MGSYAVKPIMLSGMRLSGFDSTDNHIDYFVCNILIFAKDVESDMEPVAGKSVTGTGDGDGLTQTDELQNGFLPVSYFSYKELVICSLVIFSLFKKMHHSYFDMRKDSKK